MSSLRRVPVGHTEFSWKADGTCPSEDEVVDSSIYLDFNATTPIDPQVRTTMLEWLQEDGCGNPSSSYFSGRRAKRAIERSREQISTAIGAKSRKTSEGVDEVSVFFTSGATESSNWAIKGAALAARDRLREKGEGDCLEIVTVSTEHVATLRTCEYLESCGFRLNVVRVDRYGRVDLDAMRESLSKRTVVVSMMLVNNETGTIQPVAAVSKLVRQHTDGALFHWYVPSFSRSRR